MKNIQKRISLFYWSFVFMIVFVFLQNQGMFHFFYIEQWNLFLYDSNYLITELLHPGGFCKLISEYCIQYFIHPYVGALLSASLFICISIFCNLIFQKLLSIKLLIISLLPAISVFFMHLNVNYFYTGTFAFCFMLIGIYFFFLFKSTYSKLIYLFFTSLLLFWTAGSVALLFCICILLIEIIQDIHHCYLFIIPIGWVLLLANISLHYAWIGEYRLILSPEEYFTWDLKPGSVIYVSWICLPSVLFIAFLLSKISYKKITSTIVTFCIQGMIVGCCIFYGITTFYNPSKEIYKELDYYMRSEQWDAILQKCKNINMNNYLYHCCQNVALAEKGILADELFDHPQQGLQSIYPMWDKTPYISSMLSDVYFSMGLIAYSQRMAFEANISAFNYNPRLLKRLVQTNLIFGAYPIAEKYISILEKTRNYQNWATEQRLFLYNDNAIEQDPLLGNKRKCLTTDRFIAKNGVDKDLIAIAETNPNNYTAIQYVGSIYLLIKDLSSFKQLLDTYYGTDVLPYLPKSFLEAILLCYEINDSTQKRFKIPKDLIRKFNAKETNETYWNYYYYKTIQ